MALENLERTPPIWIFDLDGTLYPKSNGYEEACKRRIFDFMVETLGFDSVQSAQCLWSRYYAVHNQTLKSLRAAGYTDFEADAYWKFFRGDASQYLKPNPRVRNFLSSLCGKKYGMFHEYFYMFSLFNAPD